MRKILYSPGYGAGWTTWHYFGTKEQKLFMLEWEPAIKMLEANGNKDLTQGQVDDLEQMFEEDFAAKFPDAEVPYLGGMRDLHIAEVSGRVRIAEYDGSESVIEEGTDEGWL